MGTYGPGTDQSQHAKSVSHIIKLYYYLSPNHSSVPLEMEAYPIVNRQLCFPTFLSFKHLFCFCGPKYFLSKFFFISFFLFL